MINMVFIQLIFLSHTVIAGALGPYDGRDARACPDSFELQEKTTDDNNQLPIRARHVGLITL